MSLLQAFCVISCKKSVFVLAKRANEQYIIYDINSNNV